MPGLAVFALIVSLLASSGTASSSAGLRGTITYMKGLVRVQTQSTGKYTSPKLGQVLGEGDTLSTLEDSRVELTFEDGKFVQDKIINDCYLRRETF